MKTCITNFDKVGTFMKAFGQEVKTEPELPDDSTVDLRLDLIEEEFQELLHAIHDGRLTEEQRMIEVADALTDILYVTYGAGHAFGIDLDRCFNEVQRSNMSKLGEDGKPIYREDGKVMKGPGYSEPDLKSILQLDEHGV